MKRERTHNAQRSTLNAEVKFGEHPLVLFTSQDGTVTVPATLERETIWLTQDQMAQIFEVKRPAVTKHLSNIFKTKELEEESTCSILEHMGQGDTRSYTTKYYNLDFLDKKGMLFTGAGAKRIADHTLVALTVMIAESKPAERELMVNLVMTFLSEDEHV